MNTEAGHFVGKDPSVQKIYKKLIKATSRFGPVKIEPKQTSIHLANRFGFAGIYTRRNYIHLELHLDHKLDSRRVVKVDQASPNRFHHTIKISSVGEVDKELIIWLKDAYNLKK